MIRIIIPCDEFIMPALEQVCVADKCSSAVSDDWFIFVLSDSEQSAIWTNLQFDFEF